MSLFKFKVGGDFQLVGQLKLNGAVSTWAGWTCSAQVKNVSVNGLIGALVDTLTASIDINGIVSLSKANSATSGWPANVRLAIDVLLTSPSSVKTYLPTAYFKTESPVTAS